MRETKVKTLGKSKNFNNTKIKRCATKKERGITLIALVITIIVLLILAAVSIATLTGQNGILSRADESKTQTEIGEEEEAIKLAYNGVMADNLGDGVTAEQLENELQANGYNATATGENPIVVTFGEPSNRVYEIDASGNIAEAKPLVTLGEAKDDSMLTKDTDTDVTVADGTVKVPAGFKVADDSGATIDDGIVITDAPDGEEGNEFVWVPVSREKFDTEFKREHFGTEEQKWWTGTFVTDKASANNMYEPIADGEANSSEVEKMYRSVKYNEGFYVGRYEAGTTASSGRYEAGTTASSGTGERGDLVIQKGANVYNYIKWGNSMTDEVGGAVQLARSFAGENGYKTVTSTLCYGVQWDAIMRWMKDVPNLTEGTYVEDSTGMGWYSDNYSNDSTGNPDHKTGIDLDGGKNEVKKIYDLAGNVYEWTMESYNTNYRVVRGGNYYHSGSNYPGSRRGYSFPSSDNSDTVGFRVTLYLNS